MEYSALIIPRTIKIIFASNIIIDDYRKADMVPDFSVINDKYEHNFDCYDFISGKH